MRQAVTLEKIDTAFNPKHPTASWDEWLMGCEKKSLPVSYTVTGFLDEDICKGKPIRMTRFESNGRKALGLFFSSPVTKIEDNMIHTFNSVYRITEIE